MFRNTKQKKLFDAASGGENAKTAFSDIFAIGVVVDTNDPMQWGRVKVVVQAWGDSWDHKTKDMPWAMYVSPFGGKTAVGTRGPNPESETTGGVSYGMWAIPKIGAQVLVTSLDEGHQQRLYLGCIYDAHSTHTMPHGRWIAEDHPKLQDEKSAAPPFGPYTSNETLIQPLANNIQQAFGKNDVNFEWVTRAADYAVSRVDVSQLHKTPSKVQDDAGTKTDDWEYTQGYQKSRLAPHVTSADTSRNYDSQVYSLTSPGFHSISMDDKMENCRIRIRTSSGHQILMDDTNERIYIATAKGNNWIEMDQDGHIDIYSSKKVSIHSNKDINLTSDASIRMHAKTGIHMHSDADIKMNAKTDIHANTKTAVKITAGKEIHIKAGGDLKLNTNKTTHVKSGKQMLMSAPDIYQNGPPADKADKADLAFYTNRVPNHEPWARIGTKKDDGHDPELDYEDKNIGRVDGGKPINRGPYFRR